MAPRGISARIVTSTHVPEHVSLAETFGLAATPLREIFDRFCVTATPFNDSMEWSWKFRPGHTLRNRIFWIGKPNRRIETADHVGRLADEIGFAPTDLDGGRATWQAVLRDETDRVTVGYAGADDVACRSESLKLYLSLKPRSDELYRGRLRHLHLGLPDSPPPGPCRIIYVYAADGHGQNSSRVYFLYPQSAYERPDVAEYMACLVGKAGVELACQHPSSGVGIKNDATDMIAVSFAPTGMSNIDHPAWRTSPILQPVLYAAGTEPELARRVHRLTWVALPADECSSELGYEVSELNVYVRLDGSRGERARNP
jgi:hypothetical protein